MELGMLTPLEALGYGDWLERSMTGGELTILMIIAVVFYYAYWLWHLND